MAISVVFISSTNVTALSFSKYTDENIWKWSYDTLLKNHETIANAIDHWPNQVEADLEQEDEDLLPDSFLTTSFLILKWGKNSYVFEGGA
jgi:hypothetical protein